MGKFGVDVHKIIPREMGRRGMGVAWTMVAIVTVAGLL
jgi:hypothetical protein